MKSKFGRFLILMMFVITVSSFLAFSIIEVAKDILGMKKENIVVEVVIPKGASTGKIAEILKSKNIIDHPLVFRVYSKLKKTDNTYREGKYILSSEMSYEDIIYAFQNMTERTDLVKVTIPEGYTVNQIADLLKENKVCNKQDFLKSVDENNFISEALNQVKKNDMIRYRLEGYLFPDTYEFILNAKPDYIIDTMLQNFDKKVLNKLKMEIEKSDMSLSEIITLASITQKESTSFEVMKRVTSVFFNRLNQPSVYPKLQSDVTILYIESDIKPNLEFKNQDMYDSYNTYVCNGLPVGPICNPGLDAVKAVLNPEKTDYNYFLTDIDNNYYWAKTLSEHNNNLYEAEKIGSVRGLDID